jgi:hypothetical protein
MRSRLQLGEIPNGLSRGHTRPMESTNQIG